MREKIKVALVNPPVVGHLIRGTGVYASALFRELEKIDGLEIIKRNFGDDVTDSDLVHYPYFDPFFMTLKINPKIKTVVTVHDLIPLKYPPHFPIGIKGHLKWFWQQRLLQKADRILTDSYASREDIINLAGVGQKKIKVVYLGVDNEFRKINDKNLLEKARKNMNLPDHFLLTVGDVNWNKNIPNLIRIFNSIHKKNEKLHLVLVGQGFISKSSELNGVLELINSFKLQYKIIRLSNISVSDLVSVYNLADLFILPSFAEGFGLPLLEAYACQCPALTTKAESLLELAGRSSVYIDPNDNSLGAEIVLEILASTAKKQEMIANGLKRVSEFSWQKCARETLDFYKKVLA